MVRMCDLVGGPEKNPSRELATDRLGLTSAVPGQQQQQQRQQDGATQVSVRRAVFVPPAPAAASRLQDGFNINFYSSLSQASDVWRCEQLPVFVFVRTAWVSAWLCCKAFKWVCRSAFQHIGEVGLMDGDRLKPTCHRRILLLLVLFMMLLLLRLSQQHSQSAARLRDLCSASSSGTFIKSLCINSHFHWWLWK